MTRVGVIVEGPTERSFVQEVLAPCLSNGGIEAMRHECPHFRDWVVKRKQRTRVSDGCFQNIQSATPGYLEHC